MNWVQLKALADGQGLSAVVLDGLDKLNDTSFLQELKLEWIGEVLQMEATYKLHQEVATDMANLFHRNAIRTYVLKGRVISECYPKPNHRVSVDMDCYLLPAQGEFDAWRLGNDLIKSKGFLVSTGFYKDSAFNLPGLKVENHKYLTPFRGNERLASLEKLLQAMMQADNGEDIIEGTWLYRPPIMVSTLFLIEHAYSHFLHEGLTWRMVLDWVLFSKKHKSEINWNDFEVYVDEFGFRKFYDSFVRLGKLLLGEISEDELTKKDKRMIADVWAP
ncbi:MAG: nucleotidyltransferase family protein, partial [Bacteroidaceae bacterium]|nr:nucleotidyltransferase family protein [Bacteroidaceae bacterium]